MSEGTTGVDEPPTADEPAGPRPDEPRRAGEPRRASALLACGAVIGIALVVTAAIVAWARLGAVTASPGVNEPEPLEEAVPDTLAGGIELGEVPDAVIDAFEGPVVGARLLDEAPEGVRCDHVTGEPSGEPDVEPDVETVLATPDAVYVSLLTTGSGLPGMGGEPPGDDQLMRATCTMRWEDGGWAGGGGSISSADDQPTGVTNAGCCDADGLGYAEGAVAAPPDAAWAVQERGGYHLAYPVPDTGSVPIGWRFREPTGRFAGPGGPTPTRVTFVDDGGEVLDEVTLQP